MSCPSRRFFRERRSRRQIVKSKLPFAIQTNITANPLQLFSMKPGDYYKLFDYHIKFFDYTLAGHVNSLKSIGISQPCHWSIDQDYFNKAADKARFAIVMEYVDTTSDNNTIYYDSFIIALEDSPTELYIALRCSKVLTSEIKQREYDPLLTWKNVNKTTTGFGIILQCVLLTYTSSIGFRHVYNHAAHDGLLNYYTRFGYRLGTQCQEEEEAITEEHEKHIQDNTTEEWYKSVPITASGYAMKLCNFSLEPLRHYCFARLLQTCEFLTKYPDTYS